MEEKKVHGSMAVLAALLANVLVAVSKFAGYMLSGSAAMMNESIIVWWIAVTKSYCYSAIGEPLVVRVSFINLAKDERSIFLVRL